MHIQVTIGSRNSAIHNAYHTSLRPSSVFEPRHPSLKVSSQWLKRTQRPQKNWSKYAREGSEGREKENQPKAQPPQRPTRFARKRGLTHKGAEWSLGTCANDPSAGSPTETLLRLLLPLSVKIHQTFHNNIQKLKQTNFWNCCTRLINESVAQKYSIIWEQTW